MLSTIPRSGRTFVAFIDAGWVRARGRQLLQARSSSEVVLRPSRLVEILNGFGSHMRGEEFLRAYVYDGALAPTHAEYLSQRERLDAIADTPGLVLREGHLVDGIRQSWQRAVDNRLRELGWSVAEFRRGFEFPPERRQKGVDTLLALDLVTMAQTGVYDTAVLVAGDRDFAEAVRLVQTTGRRVVLMEIPQAPIARELRQLADQVVALAPDKAHSIVEVL